MAAAIIPPARLWIGRQIPSPPGRGYQTTPLYSSDHQWHTNPVNKAIPARRLLLATHNAGKLAELRAKLADLPVQLVSLRALAIDTAVEETGATFRANAELKARAYAQASGLWTLAEDSGLEVDALGGEPGVHSA